MTRDDKLHIDDFPINYFMIQKEKALHMYISPNTVHTEYNTHGCCFGLFTSCMDLDVLIIFYWHSINLTIVPAEK